MTCKIDNIELPECSTYNYNSNSYRFYNDGSVVKDGKYFGYVVEADHNTITVKVNNGNRYMQGQIIEFKLIDNSEQLKIK